MNKEDQRIAISEACGWKRKNKLPFTRHGGTIEKNVPEEAWWHEDVAGCSFAPPDYLNDLNAMHEAEKVLTEKQMIEYREWLTSDDPVIDWGLVHATAAQRAEAFLRTLGLWT